MIVLYFTIPALIGWVDICTHTHTHAHTHTHTHTLANGTSNLIAHAISHNLLLLSFRAIFPNASWLHQTEELCGKYSDYSMVPLTVTVCVCVWLVEEVTRITARQRKWSNSTNNDIAHSVDTARISALNYNNDHANCINVSSKQHLCQLLGC